MDRRTFLGIVPGALIAAGGCMEAGPAAPALEAWGVQLYTVRALMADDGDRTLAALARAGYAEVELAGLYGRTPAGMRAALDAVGLRAVSSHASLADVRDRWPEVLAGAEVLGQRHVVVPSIPADERGPEALRAIADEFNRAGEAARAVGLRFGYHNHDWELAVGPDGARPMDLLLERTDPDLVDWQMDIFWTVHGGGDPAEYLTRAAGRVSTVHVKDRTASGEMVDVGQGVIDFATLLRGAAASGLEHAFVEHDRPEDPLASVLRSLEHLRGLGL